VTVDVDTIYHGFDRVLPHVDYLVASSEFPVQWTHERDPFRALEMIQEEYHIPVAAMTLGALGALARTHGRLFIRLLLWSTAPIPRARATCSTCILLCCSPEHASAGRAGVLECDGGSELHGPGARGRISTVEEARALMFRGERRSHPDYEPYR